MVRVEVMRWQVPVIEGTVGVDDDGWKVAKTPDG